MHDDLPGGYRDARQLRQQDLRLDHLRHRAAAVCTSGRARSRDCGTVISLATSPSKGKTYDVDANTNGDVCRRNNFTYGAETTGGWTLPSGNYTKGTGSCGGITTASLNRHYYKAAVQWCNAVIPASGATS